MAIQIKVQIPNGFLSRFAAATERDLAKAATGAMKEVGELAKVAGRQNIAAAGFAANTWQQAWRFNLYPKSGPPTLKTAAFLYNRIPYSNVFEQGANIRASAKPLLWVAFSTTRRLGGNKKTTPANYAAAGFKLFTAPFKTKRNKRPILAAMIGGKLTPLFYGIQTVNLKKRFELVVVSERAADRFPDFFAAAFDKL